MHGCYRQVQLCPTWRYQMCLISAQTEGMAIPGGGGGARAAMDGSVYNGGWQCLKCF